LSVDDITQESINRFAECLTLL